MNHKQRLGLAGEYRVRSELLLRGHRPRRPRSGPDIILQNGLRLEIKSASHSPYGGDSEYSFRVTPRQRTNTDFFICWCVNHHAFYIIPAESVNGSIFITIRKTKGRRRRYEPYKDAWNLLRKGG